MRTLLTPGELLVRLHQLEQEANRERIIHWYKNEIAVVQINMRNMKIWHINNFLIIKQDIQIQCPWSPVDDTFPVCRLF